MMTDTFGIKNAAISALNDLGRTSFSGDGFTSDQINAIAEAITNAIAAYDEQNRSMEN